MARFCEVCRHERHRDINLALARRRKYREIVGEFGGFSDSSLSRHARDCFPDIVARGVDALDVVEREEVAEALDVVKQLNALNREAWDVLEEARGDGDRGDRLRALDRVLAQLDYQSRRLGEISTRPELTINLDARVQSVIFEALEPHDEARVAVARALRELREAAA